MTQFIYRSAIFGARRYLPPMEIFTHVECGIIDHSFQKHVLSSCSTVSNYANITARNIKFQGNHDETSSSLITFNNKTATLNTYIYYT